MTIYLARHGQTTGDIENRYGGDYDDHLTELGQQQSMVLAGDLFNKGIDQLYASPLIRAQETAGIIGEKLGLDVTTLPGFKERNSYGVVTGMTKEAAERDYPEEVQALTDPHNTITGAEDYDLFQHRITEALEKVSHETASSVAVITHGGPIRLIFRDILKLGEIDVDDCAYVALEAKNGSFVVQDKKGISIK